MQHNLPTRFSRLLGIAVHADDGLPLHACDRCKWQLEGLEGALRDLEDFKKLAAESYSTLLRKTNLKRPKESSGTVGVSPGTLKARPPSKRPSRRLDFESSDLQVQGLLYFYTIPDKLAI